MYCRRQPERLTETPVIRIFLFSVVLLHRRRAGALVASAADEGVAVALRWNDCLLTRPNILEKELWTGPLMLQCLFCALWSLCSIDSGAAYRKSNFDQTIHASDRATAEDGDRA